MYDRHKSLYHFGLPMIETDTTEFSCRQVNWMLDACACQDKPVIYTCVICHTNYLDVIDFNSHNCTIHKELMNGCMKFTTEERLTFR